MKNYLYLTTVIIGSSMVIVNTMSWAQCVSTQDCTALGYTETSCPNGKGVKCPFGNKWFCGESSCNYVCEDLGFKYSCSGTGYSGGSGKPCNGKYMSCNCVSPYEWKSDSCSCPTEYQYSCSESSGMDGGEGTACNGKYKSCKCSTGYGWKDGSCVSMVCAKTTQIGFTCPASCSVNGNKATIQCNCGTCPGFIIGVSGSGRPGQTYTIVSGDGSYGCSQSRSFCRRYSGTCTICQEWKFPD